jgi:hypothetical protein
MNFIISYKMEETIAIRTLYDNVVVDASVDVVGNITYIKNMMELHPCISEVTISEDSHIPSDIVETIVTYHTGIMHITDNNDRQKYTTDFTKDMEMKYIFQLIKAANFLGDELLVDNLCTEIANLLRGKNVHQMRDLLNL